MSKKSMESFGKHKARCQDISSVSLSKNHWKVLRSLRRDNIPLAAPQSVST